MINHYGGSNSNNMVLSKNKINSNNKVVEIKEGKKIKKEIFYLVIKLYEPISNFLIVIRSK
jgi:hypothetical protein